VTVKGIKKHPIQDEGGILNEVSKFYMFSLKMSNTLEGFPETHQKGTTHTLQSIATTPLQVGAFMQP
jgi:hypothetical protein